METRVAVISVIIENTDSVEKFNNILHNYNKYIIGRMGIPYAQKGLNIITIVIDAPADSINALTGALGKIPDISVKAAYSKLKDQEPKRNKKSNKK